MPTRVAFQQGYTRRELEEHDELIGEHTRALERIRGELLQLRFLVGGGFLLTIAINPAVAPLVFGALKTLLAMV